VKNDVALFCHQLFFRQIATARAAPWESVISEKFSFISLFDGAARAGQIQQANDWLLLLVFYTIQNILLFGLPYGGVQKFLLVLAKKLPVEAPVIQIEKLTKSYGNKLVLKGIDLEVQPGEASRGQIIGYIGPNGAGKSTTIKILTGLLTEYGGSVKVNGLEVSQNSLEIKAMIGYVPENAVLYDTLSPVEYFRFLGSLYGVDQAAMEQKGGELLRIFGLYENRNNRMTSFSKGMKQKVLLISGMIHNPQIIFFDEPLSGLDANSVILLKEILQRLSQAGKTLFYSSHIMEVVEKICDRIVLLKEGAIIAHGTFQELQNQQHSDSLEQLFNQLTGNNEHLALAEEFVSIISDE